jgi:hypothetical protein
MKQNFQLVSPSADNDGAFYSKKRQRQKSLITSNSRYVENKTITPFRVASTIFLILTSNFLMMSQGFTGSPSIILQRRSTSTSFSGTTITATKFPSDGDGDDDDDDNDDDDQTLPSILPTDTSSILEKDRPKRLSSVNNSPRDRTVSATGLPVSSLLPPPININSKKGNSKDNKTNMRDDKDSQALSSWEDFLSSPSSSSSSLSEKRETNLQKERKSKMVRKESEKASSNGNSNGGKISSDDVVKDLLPSIADLFPSDLFTSKPGSGQLSERGSTMSDNNINNKDNIRASSASTLDGVLPVSDLFYRSAQSMSDINDNNNQNNSNDDNDNDVNEDGDQSQRDDEELPFSAEQSDQLTTSLNRIKIRRNSAKSKGFTAAGTNNNNNSNSTANVPTSSKPSKRRKLQRRGMEMLVGGVPINADPPQRCVELTYQHDKNVPWNEVIATNTRDFGPMYYGPSVTELSKEEQGLYCEFFVNSTLKWNVCPKDLRSILNKNDVFTDEEGDASSRIENNKKVYESNNNLITDPGTIKETLKKASILVEDGPLSVDSNANELSGEVLFSMGVSKEELESSGNVVLERVLATGISTSAQSTGFDVVISKLRLSDQGDGTTLISAEFTLTIENNASLNFAEGKRKCNQINSSLAQALDDGDMQLAMAAAAKKELAWPEELRNRIVEEFLFDDDDGDGPLEEGNTAGEDLVIAVSETNQELTIDSLTIDSLLNDLNYEVQGFKRDQSDIPFGMPGSPVYAKDDIFLGGGNDGVFWNYAADNAASAPYQGKLGIRLVDAVEEKAKQRHPRVIAIGDVHGCIDELQDLLRECNYGPGDIVVFLGDLVSKGPDSMAVVQMAREIGALGVRGNHDFEVVRWHQAIKSGVDPPVVGSEHFHIANCLSKADMKWMYSLPWYISSPDLGALFVHAGFVSGIRLAKQNPRLMMNMRSILPDGTVTSKFFNNWPWARLWDGPQTVLFGHDADRGLQQYEHAIGLDTGCVYGGRLTACILPEKRLVSVNAKREYFKYRRKHYD